MLKVKERELNDLPMLTFEIRFGGERKSIVNYFYREFIRELAKDLKQKPKQSLSGSSGPR